MLVPDQNVPGTKCRGRMSHFLVVYNGKKKVHVVNLYMYLVNFQKN